MSTTGGWRLADGGGAPATLGDEAMVGVIDAEGRLVMACTVLRQLLRAAGLVRDGVGQSLIESLQRALGPDAAESAALAAALVGLAPARVAWQVGTVPLCIALDVPSVSGRLICIRRQERRQPGSAVPLVVSPEDAPDSHRDPLTGLGNRLMYDDCLQRWSERAGPRSALGVLMIDLARFRSVNDTFGHACGDMLLKLVAKRLSRAVRAEDAVIRVGGDQFIVVQSTGLQPQAAEKAAARIVDLISRPYLIDGRQVTIGASVGFAVCPEDCHDPAELLRRAGMARDAAKAAGRGQSRRYQMAMEERQIERHAMEVDLLRAIPMREFTLEYQPQFNLAEGRLSGFEALLRWDCPTRGRVSPATFVPLAEEVGAIGPIGSWVIRQACREAAGWRDARLSVAVNASAVQIADDSILDVVASSLASSGLAPERLELEITETMLLNDSEAVLARLRRLRELGVQIAIDDFGTGYASLASLTTFPFTRIKIDQSFVRNRSGEPKRAAVVRAIAGLGRHLGMSTVAEGVETESQLARVRDDGCTDVQGFLFSPPVPAGRVPDLIGQPLWPKQLSLVA